MANIITSKTREKARSAKDFFREHDRGAAKPAFCYPRNVEDMREEIKKIETLIKDNNVMPTRRRTLEAQLQQKKDRISLIDKQTKEVKKDINEDQDYWDKRRNTLAEKIRDNTPSRRDIKEKRVSAWTVNKLEKGAKGKLDIDGEKMTIEQAKNEYQIISRAMDEESNIGFLQRD